MQSKEEKSNQQNLKYYCEERQKICYQIKKEINIDKLTEEIDNLTEEKVNINIKSFIEEKMVRIQINYLNEISKKFGYYYTLVHKEIAPTSEPDFWNDFDFFVKHIWSSSNIKSLEGSKLAIETLKESNQIEESEYDILKAKLFLVKLTTTFDNSTNELELYEILENMKK